MKKFARCKTYEEIKSQCAQQGVPFNDFLYLNQGWDTVVVGHTYGTPMKSGYAVYSVFNGVFYGKHPDGTEFDSGSPRHDAAPWMQGLLKFFYVEKGAEGGKQPGMSMVAATLGGAAVLA